MSVQSITAALSVQGVSPFEKLLLIVLANYADHNMQAWPAQRRLANDTCMSLRSIQRCMDSLQARGLIERERRYRHNKRMSDIVSLKICGVTESPKTKSVGVTESPTMASGCRSVGDRVTYRSFIDPNKEPSAREEQVLPLDGQPVLSLEEERANRKALANEARRAMGIIPKGGRL